MTPHCEQNNPYLEQEVFSASPLRLRWMLIRRAEELCSVVERLWMAGDDAQAGGWLLRIREILGELLDGIESSNNPVSQSVSDFYIFLLKLLSQIDQDRDIGKLRTLADLLHHESDTWQAVVSKFSGSELGGTSRNELNAQMTPDVRMEREILHSVDELIESANGLNLEI